MSELKVSKERVDHLLATSTMHYNRLHGTTTVCQVVLQNGFMLATGLSSCLDPASFDESLGRKYSMMDALESASNKIWELEAYRIIMEAKPVK